jgi:hypothetical protein
MLLARTCASGSSTSSCSTLLNSCPSTLRSRTRFPSRSLVFTLLCFNLLYFSALLRRQGLVSPPGRQLPLLKALLADSPLVKALLAHTLHPKECRWYASALLLLFYCFSALPYCSALLLLLFLPQTTRFIEKSVAGTVEILVKWQPAIVAGAPALCPSLPLSSPRSPAEVCLCTKA